MYTYGFSLLYLGFGAILLGMMGAPIDSMPSAVQLFPRILAFIGSFSYSIYLWHIPLLIFLAFYGILRKPYLGVTSFVLGSIGLGILTSKLVEIPVIRLRDRLFPQSSARIRAYGNDWTPAAVRGVGAEDLRPTSGMNPLN